jgi:hypothetical protein
MPTLTLTPVSPGEFTFEREVFNVRAAEFGAIGDGTNDDTVEIQDALDAAGEGGLVYFPAGTYLTGKLEWGGQSLLGAGRLVTNIKGLPSQDVFNAAGPPLAATSDHLAAISDLTITVDDSVDASASFPQRGGVGNACFAFDFPDGAATYPLRFNHASIERVKLQGLSTTVGGQNKSVGFYFQSPPNLSRFRDLYFYRLDYGWWDHYPTSNLTSVEFYSDHNTLDSIYWNGCGDAARFINHGFEKHSNLIVHGTGGNGIVYGGVVSLARQNCWGLTIDQVFIELINPGVGTPLDISGEGHTVRNLTSFPDGGPLLIKCTYSNFDNIAVNNTADNPIITITGSDNILTGVRHAGTPATAPVITNSGSRNQILSTGGSTYPLQLWGTGSPESAVTAPVGSLYRRTDGGASTSLYIKESGTGNTGWRAV